MKSKSLIYIVISVPLLLVLGTVCLISSADFLHAPWDSFRSFDFPRIAVLDNAGNAVVSDKGDRRLTCLSPNGEIKWQINGEVRSDTGFYTATLIGSDAHGNSWFFNNIIDPENAATIRMDLKRVDGDGVIHGAVWHQDIEGDAQMGMGRMPYLGQMVGNSMYYFVSDAAGLFSLHRVDPATGTDVQVQTFPGQNLWEYTYLTVKSDAEVFFLDASGRILRWNPESRSTTVFFANDPVRVHVPGWLIDDGRDGFYLLDAKRNVIHVDHQAQASQVAEPPAPGWFLSSLSLSDTGELLVPDEQSQGLWLIDGSTGAIHERGSGGRLQGGGLAVFWLTWAAALVGVILALILAIVLVAWVFQKRSPLLIKELILFIPIIIISVGGISIWIYQNMYTVLEAEIHNRLLAWSAVGSQIINGDDLARIDPQSQVMGDIIASNEFKRLTDNMTKLVGGNLDAWNNNVFDYIYHARGQDWYVFDQYGYFERYLPRPGFREVLDGGGTRIIRYRDAYSTWISGFSQIRKSDGSPAGVFEITIDENLFQEVRMEFFKGLAWGLILAVLLTTMVSAFTTWRLLRSIRSLRRSAVKVSEGNYDVQVEISSRDEIQDLGNAFNQMTTEIKEQIDTVMRLNQSNAKFVPRQFLQFLGKESILDIRLGDQVQREMTVLFSDIRSFTTLSEQMDPAENFNFINSYLRRMGPRIRENNGFIDKYIGDAIMALFPGGPGDALNASLAMIAGLEEFNASAGFGDINIGIGIHTGRLMLGIVGEEMRYDGTVISDAVNLASRLESLTKYYGVSIIVSGTSLAMLGEQDHIDQRFLDCVAVKGKSDSVMLHEIISPRDPERERKLASAGLFQEAWNLYAQGRFDEASRAYRNLASRCPIDPVPGIFLARIEARRREGIPAGWRGVTTLAQK